MRSYMKLKNSRIFFKILVCTMLVMGLLVFLVHSLIYYVMQNEYTTQKQKEANQLVERLSETLSESEEENIPSLIETFASYYNVNLSVKVGENVYSYTGFTPIDISLYQDLSEDLLIQPDETSEVSTLVVQKTFSNIEQKLCRLQLTMNMKAVEEASQIAFHILPYTIIASLFVSFFLAFFYSMTITRPIHQLVKITKDMEEMKQGVYVPFNRKDEIGLLADSINSLYETLLHTIELLKEESKHRSEEDQQRIDFLRSASHEMKTPLASMLIMLENMQYNIGEYKNHEHYLQVCQQEVQHLSNMVQNILDTSRIQMLVVEETKEINVKDVLTSVMDSYRIMAKAKQVHFIEDIQEEASQLTLCINEEQLKKVLSNLLQNALNYTQSGHTITVYANEELCYIENECEPLREEVLQHIYEAFYRGEEQEVQGNGLGLYIVSQILDHSQISYSFEPYEKGMRFTIQKK